MASSSASRWPAGWPCGARVLLADEPTSELDHDNRERVLALLRAEAERGAIVVMATHDPEAAEEADGEIRLDDGQLETIRVPRDPASLLRVPKPIRLPFDPITRAAQLWTKRWGRTSQPLAMASATSIMRVQQLLITDYDAIVGRHGLSFARYEALVLLAFSRDGRLGMSKIGQRLMVHPTSATNIVQRLDAQGFVERVPNPDDGRGTLAVITPAGRDAMEAATATWSRPGSASACSPRPSTSSSSTCCARSASAPPTSTADPAPRHTPARARGRLGH